MGCLRGLKRTGLKLSSNSESDPGDSFEGAFTEEAGLVRSGVTAPILEISGSLTAEASTFDSGEFAVGGRSVEKTEASGGLGGPRGSAKSPDGAASNPFSVL
jgi:hypothetical protein